MAVSAVRTGVAHAPPVLEDVSRSLGRGRLETGLRVTVPLAAPGILAGTALVFLTCAKELPATLLLRPTGMDTLATELWTRTEVAAYAAAAPYAAVLLVVAAIPAVVIYNHFTRLIAAYRALLGDAAAGVLQLVSRDLDRDPLRRHDLRRDAAE